VLADLQRTQARLAVITARQQRSNASGAEPKVAKFVHQIGTMISSISAHLATQRALDPFAPVSQADYVGWNGGAIGSSLRPSRASVSLNRRHQGILQTHTINGIPRRRITDGAILPATTNMSN